MPMAVCKSMVLHWSAAEPHSRPARVSRRSTWCADAPYYGAVKQFRHDRMCYEFAVASLRGLAAVRPAFVSYAISASSCQCSSFAAHDIRSRSPRRPDVSDPRLVWTRAAGERTDQLSRPHLAVPCRAGPSIDVRASRRGSRAWVRGVAAAFRPPIST